MGNIPKSLFSSFVWNICPWTSEINHFYQSLFKKIHYKLQSKTITRWFSVKKTLLKVLQNSQENTCLRVSFLLKLKASGLKLYLKRDSGTDVFLWILRNFYKHPFLQNTSGSSFFTILFECQIKGSKELKIAKVGKVSDNFVYISLYWHIWGYKLPVNLSSANLSICAIMKKLKKYLVNSNLNYAHFSWETTSAFSSKDFLKITLWIF